MNETRRHGVRFAASIRPTLLMVALVVSGALAAALWPLAEPAKAQVEFGDGERPLSVAGGCVLIRAGGQTLAVGSCDEESTAAPSRGEVADPEDTRLEQSFPETTAPENNMPETTASETTVPAQPSDEPSIESPLEEQGTEDICPVPPTEEEAVGAEVSRVIDGDTFELEKELQIEGAEPTDRVRLIGVDAPEIVGEDGRPESYSEEATAYAIDALEGEEVWIVAGEGSLDDYGRLLAYVWTQEVREDTLDEGALDSGEAEDRAALEEAAISQARAELEAALSGNPDPDGQAIAEAEANLEKLLSEQGASARSVSESSVPEAGSPEDSTNEEDGSVGPQLRLFNRSLVEAGLAEVMMVEPNDAYAACFEAARDVAEEAGAGLFSGQPEEAPEEAVPPEMNVSEQYAPREEIAPQETIPQEIERTEPERTETEQYAPAEETVFEEAAPVTTMESPEESTPESPLPEEPVATLEAPVPASEPAAEEPDEEPVVESETMMPSGPISQPLTEAEEPISDSAPEDLVNLPEDSESLEPSESYTVLPDTGGRPLMPHSGSFGALLVGLGLVAAGVSLRLVFLAGWSTSGTAWSMEETRRRYPEG